MATTNVASPLPDLVLAPGQTITVDTGQALATISVLNVYGTTPVRATVEAVQETPPLFSYGPAGAG